VERYIYLLNITNRDRTQVFPTYEVFSRMQLFTICISMRNESGWGVQHNVIKFVSALRQDSAFHRVLQFPPRYNWNIVESGVKHHQANKLAAITHRIGWVSQSYLWFTICIFVLSPSCNENFTIRFNFEKNKKRNPHFRAICLINLLI
jgi:hypothetical protein